MDNDALKCVCKDHVRFKNELDLNYLKSYPFFIWKRFLIPHEFPYICLSGDLSIIFPERIHEKVEDQTTINEYNINYIILSKDLLNYYQKQ
jgi:hypothetical protein